MSHLRAVFDDDVTSGVISPDHFRVGPDGRYRGGARYDPEPSEWARRAWRTALSRGPGLAVLLVGAPGAGKTTWLATNRHPQAIYYDATLTVRSTRRRLAGDAEAAGVPVIAVVFLVPFEEILRRNWTREPARQVELDRLRTMCAELERDPPHESEGFARIVIV